MLKENKFLYYFSYSVFFFLITVFTLSRTATGIYIFNFRLGEYVVAIAVGISIFYVLFKKKLNIFQNDLNFLMKILIFMYLSFILSLVINLENNFTTYIFRSSAYLWFIIFFLVGYFSSDNKFPLFKFYQFTRPLLILLYFYLTLDFFRGEEVSKFFLGFSDKFEPHKGSDVGMVYISTMFLNNRIFNEKYKFEYFFYVSALFLPLFLFVSRAVFIASFFYFIFELINYFKKIKKDYLKIGMSLILFLLIFFTSVVTVQDNEIVSDDYYEDLVSLAQERNKIQYEKDGHLSLFWFSDGRIFSADGNLDWRLQIWQDVFYDLKNTNSLIFGYGYHETIPAMNLESRKGLDGLNEQVHNFLINILARGGLFQIILYILLVISIIYFYYKNNNRFEILLFLLPILFISFFDSSMENAHFPLVFYFFLGIIYRSPSFKK